MANTCVISVLWKMANTCVISVFWKTDSRSSISFSLLFTSLSSLTSISAFSPYDSKSTSDRAPTRVNKRCCEGEATYCGVHKPTKCVPCINKQNKCWCEVGGGLCAWEKNDAVATGRCIVKETINTATTTTTKEIYRAELFCWPSGWISLSHQCIQWNLVICCVFLSFFFLLLLFLFSLSLSLSVFK